MKFATLNDGTLDGRLVLVSRDGSRAVATAGPTSLAAPTPTAGPDPTAAPDPTTAPDPTGPPTGRSDRGPTM